MNMNNTGIIIMQKLLKDVDIHNFHRCNYVHVFDVLAIYI